MPGKRLQALVGGKHRGVDFRMRAHVHRQRAERRDRIDDHAAALRAFTDSTDRIDIVHDAAAGLRLHQTDMGDRGIALQSLGDRIGRNDLGLR